MPQFQGKDVQETRVKFSGGAKELFSEPPKIDQIVNATIEGRVTGYAHVVDEKSGNLVEVVTIKVMDIDGIETITLPLTVSQPGTPPGQSKGAAA